jgi:hypothetical protein
VIPLNLFTEEWENITAVHVQHRIIFTKLLFYIGYLLNGLDFRQMIIFNWFVYLAVVFSTMRLFWKNIKNRLNFFIKAGFPR